MSNSQSWAQTFAPIEVHNRNIVYQNTWGHLAPEKNTTYRCEVLFSVSEYGSQGVTLVKDGLPNSPWMYDAINDWLWNFKKLEAGFYKVNTTFRNFRFWGKPVKVY